MYNVNTNPIQQTVPAQQPNYQQYMMNRPIYPIQQISLKGRPVASIEEARASIIDFDGSVFYFPDLANKCIYTKQINMDGTAQLNMYELKEIPVAQEISPTQYVTREEFEAVIAQLRNPEPVAPQTQPAPKLNF